MTMSFWITPLLLLGLAGCDQTDPYLRADLWRPSGANAANLRAAVVQPSDLVAATRVDPADAGLGTAALSRLRRDRVRPLLDSGLARITPVTGGSAAPSPTSNGD
jgi:hypothetical protein